MLLRLSETHHYGTELDYRRLLVYLSGVDVFCELARTRAWVGTHRPSFAAALVSGEAPTILIPGELVWYEQQVDCSSAIEGTFGVSHSMLFAVAEVRMPLHWRSGSLTLVASAGLSSHQRPHFSGEHARSTRAGGIHLCWTRRDLAADNHRHSALLADPSRRPHVRDVRLPKSNPLTVG